MMRVLSLFFLFPGFITTAFAQENDCGSELKTLFRALHIEPSENSDEQFPEVMKLDMTALKLKAADPKVSAKLNDYFVHLEMEKKLGLLHPRSGKFAYDSIRTSTQKDGSKLMVYYSGKRAVAFMSLRQQEKPMPSDLSGVRLRMDCSPDTIFRNQHPSSYLLNQERCRSSAFSHPELLPTTAEYFDEERICERVGGTVSTAEAGSARTFSCMCRKPGQETATPMKYVMDPCTQERIEVKVQMELSKGGATYFHTPTRESFLEAKTMCSAVFGTAGAAFAEDRPAGRAPSRP